MAEEFGAASQVSGATRSGRLHDEAGGVGAQEKRSAVFAHVDGCAFGGSESPRHKIFSRELVANLACRRDDVRLHVFARGTSSRADFAVGASGRVSRASQNSGRLVLGEAVEGGRSYDAAAVSARRLRATRPLPRNEACGTPRVFDSCGGARRRRAEHSTDGRNQGCRGQKTRTETEKEKTETKPETEKRNRGDCSPRFRT
jgi:hypothetical protein